MGRNSENPSKYVSFKLVVDENDLSKSRNRNVNELDKEVYNTLCKVPVYMSITEFVKKAIIYYGRVINQKTDVIQTEDITRVISEVQGQSISELWQKIDNIESLLAELSPSKEGEKTIPVTTDTEVQTAPVTMNTEAQTASSTTETEVQTTPVTTNEEVQTAPVTTNTEVQTTPVTTNEEAKKASNTTKATLDQGDESSSVIENFLKDFL